MMTLQSKEILAAAVSHAQDLGRFERVLGHEPKSAPGNGLTAAIWVQNLRPIIGSGLASTSVRLELTVRIYLVRSDPQDTVDVRLLDATDALLAAYSGDFELGGLIREVDLLGAYGDPLTADAGYIDHDNTLYRVMVVTLPLIINDLWGQAP